MGEEIDRGGGIGVSDLEHLEPVVGRARGIARIRLAQRLGHLLRRDLDLLAALLCAGDTLLGKLADHARQCDLGESEQRHRETIRSVRSSFHFTFSHGTLPFSSETISRDAICVTKVRGGGELSRSRVSISFSMSFNPARM